MSEERKIKGIYKIKGKEEYLAYIVPDKTKVAIPGELFKEVLDIEKENITKLDYKFDQFSNSVFQLCLEYSDVNPKLTEEIKKLVVSDVIENHKVFVPEQEIEDEIEAEYEQAVRGEKTEAKTKQEVEVEEEEKVEKKVNNERKRERQEGYIRVNAVYNRKTKTGKEYYYMLGSKVVDGEYQNIKLCVFGKSYLDNIFNVSEVPFAIMNYKFSEKPMKMLTREGMEDVLILEKGVFKGKDKQGKEYDMSNFFKGNKTKLNEEKERDDDDEFEIKQNKENKKAVFFANGRRRQR